MNNFLRNKVIHPFLFAAFPVLFLYAENFNLVSGGQVLAPLVIITLSSFVIFLLSRLLLKSWYKAGLFTSALVILFFLYNPLFSAIKHISAIIDLTVHHRQFALFATMLLAAFIWAITKIKSNFNEITTILNVTAFILLIPTFSKLVYVGIQPKMKFKSIEYKTENTDNSPDIYYFITDEYARHDVLKAKCNFDNTPFLDKLKHRGFYIAEKSTSNYPVTSLSIPATLNLNFIQDLIEKESISSQQDIETKKLVSNSAVIKTLKKNNYQIVSFASGISFSEMEEADHYLKHPLYASEFEYSVLNSTPLIYLLKGVFTKDLFTSHRKTILYPFEKLNDVIAIPHKKFVLIHLLSPHMPFVFDRNGNPVNPDEPQITFAIDSLNNTGNTNAYIEQIRFLNKKLIQAVDTIQKNSVSQPVIIIQGDHGNRAGINFDRINNSNHASIFANLSAFYFPSKDTTGLYQEISNVNTFRVVLNKYFNTNIPYLPDRSFHYTSTKSLDFIDVTNQVKSSPKTNLLSK